MLSSLHISNYALIAHLDLDLCSGFSVITGETGAGKSIILGALGLLQGNRADTKAIKAGEKKCIVEGTFQIAGLGVEKILAEEDIECDGQEIIIRREINASGKSRTFINDEVATLNLLREVSQRLIDIHSQHQNLLLGHETFIIDTLDSMAGHPEYAETYATAYHAWRESELRLKRTREQMEKAQQEQEFLRFQLEELENLRLESDEVQRLEDEQRILAHAEEVKQALCTAGNLLENDEDNLLAKMSQACEALAAIADFMPSAAEWSERLESARIEMHDIVRATEHAAEEIEADPQRLAYLEERLASIYHLLKKHHVETDRELLEKQQAMRRQLDLIEHADAMTEQLEEQVRAARRQLLAAANRLTESRRNAAQHISEELVKRLQLLGMPNGQVAFDFSRRQQPDVSGLDNVRFLFSANKSVAPQDIAQTASGGEIARVMLALKAIVAQRKQMPTIIFDEIDTGVSGTMAERMGQVMQQVSSHAQVLCITHLPQIAALGTHHFKVYKEEGTEGTASHIIPLNARQRVEEIANMLSGARLTPEALANARTLLAANGE